MHSLYKLAAAKILKDKDLTREYLNEYYNKVDRYENDPHIRKVFYDYIHNPGNYAKYYNRDVNKPARIGSLFNPKNVNGASFERDENTINLGSMRMVGSFPHELGHQKWFALGMGNGYNDQISITEKYKDTLDAGKVHSYDDFKNALYAKESVMDGWESGASALGARHMIDAGMDPVDAYTVTHKGLPSYRMNNLNRFKIWRAGDRDAMQQDPNSRKRPVYRPVYTQDEQRRAIAKEYELQHSKARNLLMPLGKRPLPFRHEGEWVPGMAPSNEAEWRMQEVINNPLLAKGGDVAYKFHKAMKERPLMDPYRSSIRKETMINRDWRNSQPKRKLWSRQRRTFTGYRDPYDLGAEQAELFTHSDTTGGLEKAVLDYKLSKNYKPLYWDPNDQNNIHEWLQGLAGFKRDISLPTEVTQRYTDRITSHDPEVAKLNEAAYNRFVSKPTPASIGNTVARRN